MEVLIVFAHPEPKSFSSALKETARPTLERLGCHVTVNDLHGQGFAPVLGLEDGRTLGADAVVNAAGAWSAPVARLVDVALPVRARRRTLFVVSCPTSIPDFPILIDTSGVFVRPGQNHFLCTVQPAAQEDHDDLPLDPDFSLFEDTIWPTLAKRIPAFEALRVLIPPQTRRQA